MSSSDARRFWENRARSLAWRINLAAWLERIAPSAFFVASAAALALYALRRLRDPLWPAWLALGALLLAAALAALWLARRTAFTRIDARILLESQLHLDTRLTAASAGLVPWPTPAKIPALLRWRLGPCLGWLTASVVLLALALAAPVPQTSAHTATEKPPALAQTEAMLHALGEAKLVEPEALTQAENRARELARRSPDDQYTHAALEAADALRDQTSAAVAALSRNLDAASRALQSADAGATLEQSAGRLAAALEGLRENSLPANSALLAQLPHDAPSLSRLSPQQRADLARQLSDASRRTRGIGGAAGAGASVAEADPSKPLSRDGRSRTGAAPGGTGGGEEAAPLAFSGDRSDAGAGDSHALSPADLSRLALGDRLGTTTSAPDADPSKNIGPVSAGVIAAPARGGEAVWVDRLTPAERAALKDFFK